MWVDVHESIQMMERFKRAWRLPCDLFFLLKNVPPHMTRDQEYGWLTCQRLVIARSLQLVAFRFRDANIQVTLLILRRGALSISYSRDTQQHSDQHLKRATMNQIWQLLFAFWSIFHPSWTTILWYVSVSASAPLTVGELQGLLVRLTFELFKPTFYQSDMERWRWWWWWWR